ncbi:MAG: manganese efflux pump MntP family protein [Desulfobacterota bacterium]|nr:manganese efflux pump MntP family protein [Thermodesulfobacteriota bacterium]
MDYLTLLLVAFGLSMDAFAVSVTNGMTILRHQRANRALKIGVFFGSFQALMPLIGWSIGLGLKDLISSVDHWVAFGLLSLIGLKMIYESTKMGGEKTEKASLSLWVLLMLSIATSIDAFAVGISFAILDLSIVAPILLIGTVTFGVSFLGVFIGNKTGHFFEKKIEVIGGLILIGIGLKILIEHLGL